MLSSISSNFGRFSKYISKSRTRRIPITTKRAGKGFYKGKGSRKEGYITHKGLFIFWENNGILGKFIRLKSLCAEIVVPDLSNCTVRKKVFDFIIFS